MDNQTISELAVAAEAQRKSLNHSHLRCIGCSKIESSPTRNFRCSDCNDLLEVMYPGFNNGVTSASAVKDEGQERRETTSSLKSLWIQRRTLRNPLDESGVWRFRELLPGIDEKNVITLREGNTPLYNMPQCATAAGVEVLLAKHQGMNPTGSFKDTGMTMAASIARQQGYRWVACASTGNTSASMAAYASRGGMRSLVLIPDGQISWSKLAQALDYGAVTCQLKTDFDGCMKVLNEVVMNAPVYLLNSINPYRLEGQKTAAIELLEQLDWCCPDHVIVPGGNLANSSALGKAFVEMKQLGFISALPKISIIQAEGANPLVRTMREASGKNLVSVRADTMATAIRIGSPASWKKAVRVLEATGGTVEQVSEAEIALAKAEIGAEGIGCEPASAVTLAGLKKLVRQGFVKPHETIVLILTGHLLKDPDFTLKFHRGDLFPSLPGAQAAEMVSQQRAPIVLDPSVSAVLKILEKAGN